MKKDRISRFNRRSSLAFDRGIYQGGEEGNGGGKCTGNRGSREFGDRKGNKWIRDGSRARPRIFFSLPHGRVRDLLTECWDLRTPMLLIYRGIVNPAQWLCLATLTGLVVFDCSYPFLSLLSRPPSCGRYCAIVDKLVRRERRATL